MKKIFFILFLEIIGFIYLEQYRRFCQVGDITFTVWKKRGGYCYVTPYKYWGLCTPTENYLKMNNVGYMEICIEKDSTLLIFNSESDTGCADNRVFCNLEDYKYVHFERTRNYSLKDLEQWTIQKNIFKERLPFIDIEGRWLRIKTGNVTKTVKK